MTDPLSTVTTIGSFWPLEREVGYKDVPPLYKIVVLSSVEGLGNPQT